MSTTATKNATLFNINTKSITPSWVDPREPLLIPENPLHWEAHKLQLLLERLDNQAETMPGQFSAEKYMAVLEKFTKICNQINNGEESVDEVLEPPTVASVRNGTTEATNCDAKPISMGA